MSYTTEMLKISFCCAFVPKQETADPRYDSESADSASPFVFISTLSCVGLDIFGWGGQQVLFGIANHQTVRSAACLEIDD